MQHNKRSGLETCEGYRALSLELEYVPTRGSSLTAAGFISTTHSPYSRYTPTSSHLLLPPCSHLSRIPTIAIPRLTNQPLTRAIRPRAVSAPGTSTTAARPAAADLRRDGRKTAAAVLAVRVPAAIAESSCHTVTTEVHVGGFATHAARYDLGMGWVWLVLGDWGTGNGDWG